MSVAADHSPGVAVVCDRRGQHATLVAEYLQSCGLSDVEWFLPRDIDEVDSAVRAGRVRRVIFPALDDFLSALWDEPLDLDAWLAPNVSVEFAEPSGPTDPLRAAAILAHWQRYQTRRRRAQIVAGLILSVGAIAAASVVLALAR